MAYLTFQINVGKMDYPLNGAGNIDYPHGEIKFDPYITP